MPGGGQGPRKQRRGAKSARLKFDADPERLGAEFGATLATASRRFRILRPEDLVVLDVLCWDVDLASTRTGPVLMPTSAESRLEVRLPFQHLGEKAYFRVEPVPPNDPPEPPEAPPIPAFAARGSRLVFAVPEDERIPYSIEGVLAALSRLPLLVAPVATPRGIAAKLGPIVAVAELTGGLVLARTPGGMLVVATPATKARATRKGDAAAAGSVSSVLAAATSLRTARAILSEETAVDLSGRDLARSRIDTNVVEGARFGRGFGDLLMPVPVRRPVRARPRIPGDDETAIEAPFRLIISPSTLGGFAHSPSAASAPAGPERVELWHSRLGVGRVDPDDGTVSIDETRNPERLVRA
ncbi:MAG: hypothetical protein Q8K72_09335, partial [Acidimicrobiales bacterium]|nr:hypothetical protein [Acidimicrobiales bacterium]